MIFKAYLVVASMFGLTIGLFIFLQPLKTFAIQKKFYELINWRIEPISISKEIRNTKIMGLFLISFVIAVWVYSFFLSQ